MENLVAKIFEKMIKAPPNDREILFRFLVDEIEIHDLVYAVVELYIEKGNDTRIDWLISILENKTNVK